MKAFLLILSTFVLLFATTPEQREVKLKNVVDMQVKNTNRIEKRISKIHSRLERRAELRMEKNLLREAKLKKLDEDLQKRSDKRQIQAK